MASIKKNIILNGINTVTSILFPMVTFPYTARVLLPEGIGLVNFQLSIINYIVLFTSLGIPLYAVKEIAKYQKDKITRDKVTVEILILSVCLCLFGYLIVWLLSKYIPQIHQQSSLFFVLSLSIVFNVIGVNWFYQGIEDFKFITIRAVIFRTLSVASLFIFVKDSNDIIIYAIINVAATVGNNIINLIHLRKHLNWRSIRISYVGIVRHLKPATHIFILNLIVSLYVQLNTIMIGFMQDDDEVGYFTAGTRITHIGLTLISSLATVLLPRSANLLHNNDKKGFTILINKSARLIVALSLPMIMGLMLLATPITLAFCGSEYEPSIPILYLNAPVILFIGLTNVMGIQVLYPMNKVNLVILSVTGGAIINIVLNFILIPKYGATGAAIATLFAEFSVLIIQAILGRNYYPFSWRSIFPIRYFISTIIMGIIVLVFRNMIHDIYLQLLFIIPLGMMIYGLCLYLWGDDIVKDGIKLVIK